jgi:hypothetical protein
MGIIDRISALSGTEAAKAMNFAHETFMERHGAHGHSGRALVETVAEVCRNHPNIVGIAAGLMVEQLLVHEKHHHDELVAGGVAAGGTAHPSAPHLHHPTLPHLQAPHLGLPPIRLEQIRPGRIALEVFGALVLLKFSRGVARALRKRHTDPWFAPAAKIRLFSGSLAAYYLAKAMKARKVSAWRNAAVALFATDALKPVLKARSGAPPSRATALAAPATSKTPAPTPPPAPESAPGAVETPAPPPPNPPIAIQDRAAGSPFEDGRNVGERADGP